MLMPIIFGMGRVCVLDTVISMFSALGHESNMGECGRKYLVIIDNNEFLMISIPQIGLPEKEVRFKFKVLKIFEVGKVRHYLVLWRKKQLLLSYKRARLIDAQRVRGLGQGKVLFFDKNGEYITDLEKGFEIREYD